MYLCACARVHVDVDVGDFFCGLFLRVYAASSPYALLKHILTDVRIKDVTHGHVCIPYCVFFVLSFACSPPPLIFFESLLLST
jgi:hypothetical protein